MAAVRNLLSRKRTWAGIVALVLFGALSSCSGGRALMQTAGNTPKGAPAFPAISASTPADWNSKKADIKQSLEKEVYGEFPKGGSAKLVSERTIDTQSLKHKVHVTELIIQMSIESGQTITPTPVVLAMPQNQDGPVPIIIMGNFCPNHAVIPIDGLSKPAGDYFDCSGDSFLSGVFTYFFGRYITTPPIETIIERGYGLAIVHPPEFMPDSRSNGAKALEQLQPNTENRWGAITAWAWQAQRITDILEARPDISEIITYGHSRYGKSALLAAAFDSRIDGVISHQSGTGGASLSRNKAGESVNEITQAYPHWFNDRYDEKALTIDQHHLLALIAPRPIFLGNAKRDVWSDPDGAFRAAQGSNPAYALYGSGGLTAQRLNQFRPSDDIAFWLRPGTHGIVEEDWPAFLEFLDAHFKP